MFGASFIYHKHLCPDIWDSENHINPLVGQSLGMIAWEFVRYLRLVGIQIQDTDVRDIFIYGSITNFYWNKNSDIDICILADLSGARQTMQNVNWFMLLKVLFESWRSTFCIKIYGRTVDISVSDVREQYGDNTGFWRVGPAFSILHGKWIHEPVRIDMRDLRQMRKMARKKYRVMARQCKYMMTHNMSDTFIDAYLIFVKKERGENVMANYAQPITSTEIAYKMLKNNKIFRKLHEYSRMKRSETYRLD